MDTSETYIKMCEKVWSDIGQLPSNGCPSLFITKDRKKWPGDGLLLSDRGTDKDILGQVYRQDQLQEIYGDYINCLEVLYWWQECIKILGADHEEDYWEYTSDSFDSMEKLWLAIVMFRKFNKTWDGEEWILQSNI